MRVKTLKQIADQVFRIKAALASKKMTEEQEARFWRVAEIGKRYRKNAYNHIKATGIDTDNFGYLPVSSEVYAK